MFRALASIAEVDSTASPLEFARPSTRTTTAAEETAKAVLIAHPLVLAAYMEEYRSQASTRPVGLSQGSEHGLPPTPVDPRGNPLLKLDSPLQQLKRKLNPARAVSPGGSHQLAWLHLIYAYMIENTRLYEIFRRVLFEYRHGEKLGTPLDDQTQQWLRTTEELFYSDPAPFFITKISSHVRPDASATRRNAYQRMFGMDLNHGGADGKPYPFTRADAANTEFSATFEELLREVWIGITYVSTTNSANPTDESKIGELAEKIQDMLLTRRKANNLSREEFSAVSAMSWFHLTLDYDTPIVKSLRAEAAGLENRLFKIAERVGLPAHGLSKSFFDIAEPIAAVLAMIEQGIGVTTTTAPVFFDPAGGSNPVPNLMRTIITHWTAITGRDVKARKIATN